MKAVNPIAHPEPAGAAGAHEKLGTLDVDAYLADPERKQAFVTPMFDIIAPRYDDFTRLFSFGMDRRWKRLAIDRLVAALAVDGIHAPLVVDLASGTGDIGIGVARAIEAAEVVGIDASPRMTEAASMRLRAGGADADLGGRVDARIGDMSALDLGASSVDAITAGYGVRNVPDARRAVREMARVLKPGGRLVTLDFYRPERSLWRALLLAYLRVAGDVVGWWWHRDPVVYGYIARSIDRFMSWQAFTTLLRDEGFGQIRVTRFLGGGIALHEATRRPRSDG